MDATHLGLNRAYWDEAAGLHRESYDTASLVSDPHMLSGEVEQDSALMAPFLPEGSVAGLDLLHLQCHIGTDTLSWARLGARATGVDMSAQSLRIARDLAARAGTQVEFLESTIADAAAALQGRDFDVVYTSIGVLGWLDDLGVWARLIAQVLRPDGLFYIREAHPMALSLDDKAPEGELRLGWPYFDLGPVECDEESDYSSPVPLRNTRTVEWAHPLTDILGSLLSAGLAIVDYQEHRTLPWALLPWMKPTRSARSPHYALPEPLRHLCPLAFSLVARHR
jgi:SAM-dependent methyltransferase